MVIKTERTQIHFLRDVFVAIALLDLKVPIIALRFGDHGTKEMLELVGSKVCSPVKLWFSIKLIATELFSTPFNCWMAI